MKIDPKVEKLFFSSTPQVLSGEGYAVQVFSPFAVRYIEGDKTLTISAEPQITERRCLFFLPLLIRILVSKTWIELRVPEVLVWDNTDIPVAHDDVIIERIKLCLNAHHVTYRIKSVITED